MEHKESTFDKILKTIKKDNVTKNKILFESGEAEVDLKTDLTYPEDIYVCALMYNDLFLESKGLKPIYNIYLTQLFRKRFSLDRGSRNEFVDINKKDFVTDDLRKLGSINSLNEVRK